MAIALVLPPLTQLNTPYPSITFLARSLRARGEVVSLHDLGLELLLAVLGPHGIGPLFDELLHRGEAGQALPDAVWEALARRDQHQQAAVATLALLQSSDPTLARRVLAPGFVPATPRTAGLSLDRFGAMGLVDGARYLATRYLADLADLVAATVEPGFALSSYQHQLALGPVHYDALHARLGTTSWVDARLDALVDEVLATAPELVGISCPFPGTLYGALRISSRCRAAGVPVLLGGGYVNTELREVDEPRLFDVVDGLVFDDGEGPLEAWLDHQRGGPDTRTRTRTRHGLHAGPDAATPTEFVGDTDGLDLGRYLQVVDSLSPTHRLWGDGCWHKVMLAHGCYWKRCAFCDIHVDYVSRYEPALVERVLDQLEEQVARTGICGVHLVDEAAPPRALRTLALGILERGLTVSWWGNIRFEEAFTPDLCRLLAASGCVAVTGGLEVASDRLLRLMDKGITVAQAARCCSALSEAGISVHAYLMYGFPTQTLQETVDSAEVVRQLFVAGLLDSAFWHRFVVTRGSAVFRRPDEFSVSLRIPEGVFAANDIPHDDPTGTDHDACDAPLAQMLEAWMRGESLADPVHRWFALAPPTTLVADHVVGALGSRAAPRGARLVWLGGAPLEATEGLLVPGRAETVVVDHPLRDWLAEVLLAAEPGGAGLTVDEALEAAPLPVPDELWDVVREVGLVQV